MEKLTPEKLHALADYTAPLCLTITMPCEEAGDWDQKDSIRLKNTLQEAREKLKKIGKDDREINDFLAPLEKESRDKGFWKQADKGLLICATGDNLQVYTLPFAVALNVIVDRHFYLRPVIPHMQQDSNIALLLLNMDKTQMLFASALDGGTEAMSPPGELESFSAFMGIYDVEKSLQHHSQGRKGGGKGAENAMFHGQGAAGDDAKQKAHLKEYIKQLSSWISGLMRSKGHAELFFVADPQMEGLLKATSADKMTTWHKLAAKNPSGRKPEEWVDMARKALQDDPENAREQTLATYRQLKAAGNGVVKESIPEIVKAAESKRISTLLLPETSQDYFWGRYDPETHEVTEQERDERYTGPGDELVNLAVIQTYLNGGRVMTFPANDTQGGEGPDDARYAALCRW